MKRIGLLVLMLCGLGLIPPVSAQEFHAEQPFLLTSAGQSADVLLVKVMAQKAGLKFTFDKLAKPEQLKDNKTLVFVAGGSTKGLGAAKIDKEQELKRVQALIAAARKMKMPIITIHVGGQARRGELSDAFNRLTAENADYLIVLKTGDTDGLFAGIAKEKRIPLTPISQVIETEKILKALFSKTE